MPEGRLFGVAAVRGRPEARTALRRGLGLAFAWAAAAGGWGGLLDWRSRGRPSCFVALCWAGLLLDRM